MKTQTINIEKSTCNFYSSCTESYRFGFNGQENDNEVKGTGNQIDFKFRAYDPRLGRFLSVDPLTKDYPWYSPYQFAGNTPIWARELEGLEPWYSTDGIALKQLSGTSMPLTLLNASAVEHGPYSLEYAAGRGLTPTPSITLAGVVVTPNGSYPDVTRTRNNDYSPYAPTTEEIEYAFTTTAGLLKTAGVVSTLLVGPEVGLPLYAAGESFERAGTAISIADNIQKGNYKDALIDVGAQGASSTLNNLNPVKELGGNEVQKFAVDALSDKLIDKTKESLKKETSKSPKK